MWESFTNILDYVWPFIVMALLTLPAIFGVWFFCIVFAGAIKDAGGE